VVGEKDGPYGETNVHEAKTHLSLRLEECAAVVIARPEAGGSLVAVTEVQRRQPGSAKGTLWYSDDFDAPLPDEILSRSSAEGIADTHAFFGGGSSSLVRGGARFCPTVRGRCCLARRVAGRWRSRSDCVEVTGSRFTLRAAFGERHRGTARCLRHASALPLPNYHRILRPPARRPG